MKKADNDLEIFSGSTEPAYSEDGVDLTLIRWMLSYTDRTIAGVETGY